VVFGTVELDQVASQFAQTCAMTRSLRFEHLCVEHTTPELGDKH
jgi:hypothetical protein